MSFLCSVFRQRVFIRLIWDGGDISGDICQLMKQRGPCLTQAHSHTQDRPSFFFSAAFTSRRTFETQNPLLCVALKSPLCRLDLFFYQTCFIKPPSLFFSDFLTKSQADVMFRARRIHRMRADPCKVFNLKYFQEHQKVSIC